MTRKPYWEQTVTPDNAVVGEYVHRTTVEEVCQLLGHDAAEVVGILLMPDRVDVMTKHATATVLHRHVVR